MIIVDTHVHVGVRATDIYVPVEELLGKLDKNGVEKAVLVQMRAGAPTPVGNTDNTYLSDCVRKHPKRLVAVGIVDWTKDDAPQRLEYEVKTNGIQGIRIDGNAMSPKPDIYAIWRKAAQLGTVISTNGRLTSISEVAKQFPNLRICVELHTINPPDILALAEYQNVFVKFTVTGLQKISKQPYPYTDAHPFFEKLYRLFGPKRIMWGSNYPPVAREEEGGEKGYENALLFLQKEIPYLSEEVREWMMGKTALQMWRFR